jgi:superfamily II DNA or RNA helicase
MKTKDQIQLEALDAIGTLSNAGIEVSMGVGKTLLGLKHMAKNYTDISRFLVVAPRVRIFDSWLEEATKHGYEYLLDHIDFTTYVSLTKHDLDYDVVYLDECHSLKENYSSWLKAFQDKKGKLIGMTGTYPVYNTSEKGKMCNKFCPKVYSYTTDSAVDDKILNDYQIYIHRLRLGSSKSIMKKRKDGGVFYTSEISDYNYWSDRIDSAMNDKSKQIAIIQRMKCLQKLPLKVEYAKKLLKHSTKKTIAFASTIKQADEICRHSVHSKNKKSHENLEDFKIGMITKLSAVEQLSEGVTIPGLEVGIILHSYGNNRKASQKIGRLLRLNPEDKATIHILCYENSIDKKWVEDALSHFDQSKITWVDAWLQPQSV